MTIKKRLIISNIFMIVIPVAICIIVAGIALGIGYNLIINGKKMGFDVQNFYDSKEVITHQIDEALYTKNKTEALDNITKLIDGSQVRLVILNDENEFYAFGNNFEIDTKLMEYKSDNEVFLILQHRQMYRYQFKESDNTYDIMLFCNTQPISYHAIKEFIIVLFIILVVFVLLSVSLTNYFLSKFVFKKIEEPLDLLLNATQELSCGNYEINVVYKEENEFKIIIDEFNLMVIKMKEALELERKEENKKRMLILALGHDIKSPLTSIKGYVEGLIDGVASSNIKRNQYLQVILKKCDEIANLVNNMLSLKNYDNDTKNYFSLKELTNNFINDNKASYEANNLKIKFTGKSDLKIKIKPEDYYRILSNILDNSVKYASKEEIVEVITLDGANKKLIIEDNGIGVDDDCLPYLFDVFYRTDSARSHPENGSGLGLFIVRDIINAYSATIKAYNTKSHGLGFEIVFGGDTSEKNFNS